MCAVGGGEAHQSRSSPNVKVDQLFAVGLVPRIGFPAARVADGKTGSVVGGALLWFFWGWVGVAKGVATGMTRTGLA